jgi:hypothetical protein
VLHAAGSSVADDGAQMVALHAQQQRVARCRGDVALVAAATSFRHFDGRALDV